MEDKLPGYDLGSNHVAVELGTGRTPLEEEVELTTSTERIPGGKAVVVQLAVGDTFQYQEIGRPDIPSRVKVHGRFVDKQQVGWFYHLEDLYEEDDIGVHGDEVRITQVVDDDGYREVDVHVDENGYFTLEARPGTINITYEYNDETRTSEHDTDHYAAIVQIDTEGESPEPSPEPEPEPEPGPGPDEELQPTSLQIRSFVVQEDVPVPEADQADLLIRGKRPSEDQWRTLDRASQVERYSYDIDQPEEFRDVLLSIQATYAGDKDVEEETKSFVIKDLNYHLSTGEPINKVISFTESTRSPSPEGGEPKPIEIHVTSRLYESETGKPVGLIETDIFLEVHEDDKWVTAEQQSTTDGRTTFKIDPNRYHGEHVRVRGTHERDQDVQEQTQPLTDLDAYMERGEPLEKELRFDRDDDHDEETDTAEVHGRLVQAERVSKAVSQEEANELLEAKKEGAVGKGLAGTVTLLSHDGENAKRLDTTESDGNGFFAFNVPMEQVQGKHLAVAGVPKHTKQKRSSFARHYNGGYPQDWFQVSEDQPEQSVIIPVQQRPLQIGLSPSYTNILANKELNTGPIGELQSTEEQEKQITFNVQANRPGIGVPKLYFLSTDEVQEVPEEAITISAEKQAPEQKNGAYRFKGETKQTIKVDLEFAEEPPCLKRLYCVIYRDEETASSTMFDDLLPTLLNQEYNNQNGDTALPLWTRLYSTASEVDLDSYLHDFDFVDVKLVGSEYVSRRKKRTENRIKQKVLQPIGEAGMQSESNWTSEQFADHDYVIAFTNDFEWKAEVVQEKIENILEIAHEVEHVFYEHLGQVARYYEDYDDFKTDLETLHSVQKAEDLDQRRTLLQQRQGDVPQTGQELMQRVYQTFYEVFNTETGIALKEEES